MRAAAGEIAGDDSTAFVLSFDADLPLVQADAAQLERVFVERARERRALQRRRIP